MPHKLCNELSKAQVQTPTKKFNHKKFLFLTISAILIIFLIGITLWIFFSHNDDKVSTVITSTSVTENDGIYTATVTGKITNNSSKKLNCVQIIISLYDSEYNVIGTAIDKQLILGAGETWIFSAEGISSTTCPTFYKVADVTYR
ncbi:MAG: hypothetical protein E7679_05810 [Ruminococcaceae bacterium]|nr:hypothetical protein [Oscillospiraceae bacterium]